jgi:hypothetical protein
LFRVLYVTVLRKNQYSDDPESLAAEIEPLATLSKGVGDTNHLPLVRLGLGRGSTKDKFEVIMHACMLIAGKTAATLCTFVKEFAIGTFDYGAEFGIRQIEPIHVEDLFSYLPHSATRGQRQNFVAPNVDEFEVDVAGNRDPSNVIDLTSMSGISEGLRPTRRSTNIKK